MSDLLQAGLWLAFGILAVAAFVQVVCSADWIPHLFVLVASAVALPISLFLQPHPGGDGPSLRCRRRAAENLAENPARALPRSHCVGSLRGLS